MNLKTFLLAACCVLSPGILRHLDGIVTASSASTEWRQISCEFEMSEITPLSSEKQYIRQHARLLLRGTGSKEANPPNAPPDKTVTFILQDPSVNLLQHVDEATEELECTISPYFTDNTQIVWPGLQLRAAQLDAWYTGTIRHVANRFALTVFFVQPSSTHRETGNLRDLGQGSSESLLLSGVFLVRSGPFLVQSGLNKDVVLNCAFSVNHWTDVTIKWVLQQKGGHKKLIYAYGSPASHTEPNEKRAEMFLLEIPKGNASLLLRNVTMRDEGTYSCLVLAASLLGEQNVRLEIAEKPSVMLNTDTLSLVEGEEHKLICEVGRFYPLDAHAQWLQEPKKQGLVPDMVNHVLTSSHRQNSDGTYSFSSYFLLKASLKHDGQRFTCRVDHRSLKYPIRKSVMVKVTESTSDTWIIIVLVLVLAGLLFVMLTYLHKVMNTNKPKPY
uniref:Ig-like domain-containing protein n=1 Tax=Sphenodon punctatus TaxID=8508 RepID=A0A8D0L296_SPHPU